MTRHTVNMGDFVDLCVDDSDILNMVKYEIVSSYGKGSNKTLGVVVNILTLKVHFEVKQGNIKTTAYTLKDAIALYNDLP